MSSAVEAHVLRRIASAPLLADPFPHCIVDGIFPLEFYERMLDEWPEDGEFERLVDTRRVSSTYSPSRLVIELNEGGLPRLGAHVPFWRHEVLPLLHGPGLAGAMMAKFAESLHGRVPPGAEVGRDCVLVSDRVGYALGPHTDAPHRLLSALFYLPLDEWTFAGSIGTSLYRPKQAGFTCAGGPSYPFDAFERVKTVAFLPNRLFLFPKTATSFHGVEPIAQKGLDRRMLLFDLRVPRATRPATVAAKPVPAA